MNESATAHFISNISCLYENCLQYMCVSKEERALKKQLESQPSPFGRADYEGSIYRPWESALKKRLRTKRALERAKIKERGAATNIKESVCIDGFHCPNIEM